MLLCVNMQQLLVTHLLLTVAGIETLRTAFGPRCLPAHVCLWCLVLALIFLFFSFLQGNFHEWASPLFLCRKLMQRKTVLETSNSRVRWSLSHICFMWLEDFRSGTPYWKTPKTKKEAHTLKHLQLLHNRPHMQKRRQTWALSLSGLAQMGKNSHCLEAEEILGFFKFKIG